jgi:MFS family permease
MPLFPTAKSDPELLPFRPGLVFALFNALAWQIGIGTPMVLFAEQLGATPFQVGLAYSFVFVLTPIQVVSTALIPRFGFKAVMLGGWRTRSFFLAVPAVLAALAIRGGEQPWMVKALVWSVFFFCFFRSIGAASGISWFYAILPENARGRYFASDQFVAAVGSVGTLMASAAVFALLPVYTALLVQYLIALGGSIVSYYSLKRLPDAERPDSISLRTVVRDTPRHLFTPSAFRTYVWLAVASAVVTTPIPPFSAYYLKVVPRLSGGEIMLLEVMRYSGVMIAAWLIRGRIDVVGAKPFFLLAFGVYLVVGAYWWFFLENGLGGLGGIVVAYFLLGFGVATWSVANLHYLPKLVSAAERTLAVSIYGAVTAFMGGLAPIGWGLFLRGGDGPRAMNTDVFQWFFVVVVVAAVVLSSLYARLPEDKGQPVDPILIGNAILRPFRAMTYLVNLIDPRSLRKSGGPKPEGEAAKPDPEAGRGG